MRNFIQILVKYHIFLLFLGLQVLCFWLIFQNNSFHRASYLNSSKRVVATMLYWKNTLTQYIELQSINDQLARENEELKNRLNTTFIPVNEHFVMINDTLRERKYRYKTARVINSSVNKQLNFLTINKGRKDGIGPEMAVMNANGLVGVVKDVSEHYSTVIPIINLSFIASAELERSGYFGLLKWDGRDARYASLNDVPGHADVMVGDTVVTRGASGIYPLGVPIGRVHEVEHRPGSNFHQIRVELFNDFGQLRHVYAVENLLREEKLQLESKVDSDGA